MNESTPLKKDRFTDKGNTKASKKTEWLKLTDIVLTTLFTILFIVQIINMFLFSNELGFTPLVFLGYIFWAVSIYLGFIPFFIFKRKGGVKKGDSYVKTTKVVDEGPYSIIRHPQYLAGVFFTISITLWTQTLFSFIITVLLILLTYQWTYREEQTLVQRFGNEYKAYQKRVARLNPIYGIYKYFTRKKKEDV